MAIFNTVYKSFKQGGLPSEYQEVEYIQSSGTQKINTGYTTNNNIRIVTKFMCNGNSVNVVFGTSLSSWAWNSCLCFLEASDIEVGASTSVSFSATTGTDYEMDYTLSSITVNGTTQTLSATTGSYELTLFYGNTNGGRTRIYSFEIYTGTTLERDFVPCYRKSDDEIGMYDLVNNVFYTNSGSGTFIKGPDVGGEWQPGANTIAYWTLNNTLGDSSGNGYTLTNAGEGTFVQEISGNNRYMLYCNGNWYGLNTPGLGWVYTQGLPSSSTNEITLNIRAKCLYDSSDGYARGMFDTHLNSYSDGVREESYGGSVGICVGNGSGNTTNVNISNPDTYMSKWSLWTITYSRTTEVLQIYIDGVLNSSGTSSYSPSNNWLSYFTLGIGFSTNQSEQYRRTFYGYIGATVLEDKVRTAQEIADYYNQTKGNYGL